MLVFEQPAWFLLLALVPPAIWLRHFRHRRSSTVAIALSEWNGRSFRPPVTWQGALNAALAVLSWVSVGLLVAAMAAPVSVERERVYINRGIDFYVVMDCSPSMAAQDFGGRSRFERAREAVGEFIGRRQNDPIGLIAFGSEALTVVPPTLDYEALRAGLDGLRIMDFGDGTAIGLALALTAAHTSGGEGERTVAVLVTDGEQNEGEIGLDMAASLIKAEGIKLYAVGLGGAGELPLEYADPRSGKIFRGTYLGQSGAPMLADLAAKSGGTHIDASLPGTLEGGFDQIDTREQAEARTSTEATRHPLGRFFVLWALIGIVGEFALRRIVLKESL